MRMTRGMILALAGLAIGVVDGSGLAQMARLELQSQPGDPIGEGRSYDISYFAPADIVSSSIADGLPSGKTEIYWVLDSPAVGNQWAYVAFGTSQLGFPIQPGTYMNAQRAAFAQPGHPGLEIAFQNKGSNTLTGSFTVEYVTFGFAKVESFRATFEQHYAGIAPALFGTFTYSATLPEPQTAVLVTMGAAFGILRRRNRR